MYSVRVRGTTSIMSYRLAHTTIGNHSSSARSGVFCLRLFAPGRKYKRTGNSEVYIQKIRDKGTDSTGNVPFTDATVFKLTILLALSSVRILAQNRLSKRAKRKREDVYTGMRHGNDMEANEAEAVDRPGGERVFLTRRFSFEAATSVNKYSLFRCSRLDTSLLRLSLQVRRSAYNPFMPICF